MTENTLRTHVEAVQKLLEAAREQGIYPGELLGHVFQASKEDPLSLFCIDLRRATAVTLSETFKRLLPQYLSFYETLVARGYTEKNAVEVGSDSYVYYLPEQVYGMPEDKLKRRKALAPHLHTPELSHEEAFERHKSTLRPFVLTTQGEKFLVVMVLQYGEWSLHIRRFWDDLEECLASDSLVLMNRYRTRKDFSLKDVVRLAQDASEAYSDAQPGNPSVWRPSLKYILSHAPFAPTPEPGSAFQFYDVRDSGYIVSYKPRGGVDADSPEWQGTGHVKSVVDRLNLAIRNVQQ